MSDGSGSDGFEEVLAEIVYGAFREGTKVEGGWDIYTESTDGLPDFTVEISRVEK